MIELQFATNIEGQLLHNLVWREGDPADVLRITFYVGRYESAPHRQRILMAQAQARRRLGPEWIRPGTTGWIVDLDGLTEAIEALRDLEWLRGKVVVQPEVEITEREVRQQQGAPSRAPREWSTTVVLYIDRDMVGTQIPEGGQVPDAIRGSLARFREDHPDPRRAAFVMMRFGDTEAHRQIMAGIDAALSPYGIRALRADQREYHEDLLYNVLTYVYGSGFGIAVFERIEAEEFNPNVALEVGYMMALGKPVCLLKDRTLRTLHADLVGRLYRAFDPQHPVRTIPPELNNWLRDKGLV
jgi:hypothetical protein